MREDDWLKKRPIIKFNEIARRVRSNEYAKLLVYRLVKTGRLKKITKGVYSTSEDIFSIASEIYFPSYITGLSGAYLYGITEVIPITISVATPKKHKEIDFNGYKIEFLKSKEVWGYHKEQDVFLADKEKLLIDAFLYPEQMGNFEEIENLFKKIEGLNLDKLKNYLQRLRSNKVYRQLGYMLEKHKNIDISGLMKINNNYYDLNPFEKGRLIGRKWRLRV